MLAFAFKNPKIVCRKYDFYYVYEACMYMIHILEVEVFVKSFSL